jgi:hypothetical protein
VPLDDIMRDRQAETEAAFQPGRIAEVCDLVVVIVDGIDASRGFAASYFPDGVRKPCQASRTWW